MTIIQGLIASISGVTATPPPPVSYNSWTVEWFQKSADPQPNSTPRVFGIESAPNQSLGFSIENVYYAWVGNTAVSTSVTPVHNVWQHWAMVSDANVLAIYLNGSRVALATRNSFGVVNDSSNNFYIGIDSNPANGYKGLITNFRIVKNQAMYDPSLTTIPVPSVPLGSNTNTELLLKAMDNNTSILDSSDRNRSPFGQGGFSWSTDTPFTARGPYTQTSNQSGQAGNGTYVITFAGAYYNADLLNVKAGWTVTNGSITSTVAADAVENTPGYIDIGVTFDPVGINTWTFTQPPLGGSIDMLTFPPYGYLLYNAGPQWALDVV
jgi:hypothetical protein